MSDRQYTGTPAFTDYEATNGKVASKIVAGQFVKLTGANIYAVAATTDVVVGVAGEETFKDGAILHQTIYFEGLIYCTQDPTTYNLTTFENTVALKKYDETEFNGFIVKL